MSNILAITVPNPDEIRNDGAYGTSAIVRLQWAATSGGSYADVSGTGSTPTLDVLAATTTYTGYDPGGDGTTWYRTRYENGAATRLSDWSTPFQNGAAGIVDILDAKLALGFTDASEDANLARIIGQVTTYIMGKTDREFLPAHETRTFDIEHWPSALEIPTGIRAVTTLGYANISQPDDGGTYGSLAAADFHLRPLPIERNYGWPATRVELDAWAGPLHYFYPGHNTVQIEGDFGWSAVPPDIAGIGLTLVVGYHRERGSSGGDSFTVNIDGSRTFERMLSKRDRDTLEWYSQRNAG